MKSNVKHLGLIPDGNRRWAKEKGLPSIKGHVRGQENFSDFCDWCQSRGVKELTTYGFSTENWNRPKKEIRFLMRLFEKKLMSEESLNKFQKRETRVRVIGQREKLPKSLQKAINKVERVTKENKKLKLNLAISYGGRWDIKQAIKKIVKEESSYKEIDDSLIEKFLCLKSSPDLIIRTSGEKRLSNFLIWQVAYSELYFSNKYWPDFKEEDLDKALKEYSERQRRYGQ